MSATINANHIGQAVPVSDRLTLKADRQRKSRGEDHHSKALGQNGLSWKGSSSTKPARRSRVCSRWEVMKAWNRALAGVMVTKTQMWEMSAGKENMTSFSGDLDEQQRRMEKNSSFWLGAD